MSRYYRKCLCVPTVHPTPSTSPTIEAQINKHLILNICVIDLSFSCRACRGCRVHCRDAKTFPVVPRHGLVSYRGVPVSMVRHKKLLKAPKCLISLITLFFGTPCLPIFTPIYTHIYPHIYPYIPIFTPLYAIYTHIYTHIPIFTHIYPYIPIYTHI